MPRVTDRVARDAGIEYSKTSLMQGSIGCGDRVAKHRDPHLAPVRVSCSKHGWASPCDGVIAASLAACTHTQVGLQERQPAQDSGADHRRALAFRTPPCSSCPEQARASRDLPSFLSFDADGQLARPVWVRSWSLIRTLPRPIEQRADRSANESNPHTPPMTAHTTLGVASIPY